MTRALTSLAGTLAAIPDSARILLTRPGDTELPATVIQDREWLAGQIRLRGQIWGIDDRRTLATLWWYSASTMLVTPGILAIATDGTCLSPRLDHIDIHHQPDSRFSGSHGTRALPEDDLGAFAAELRSTLGTVIGQQQVGRWRARHRRPRGHQGLAGGPRPGSGISRGTRDSTARAALVSRYQAVAPVLKVLPGVIPFGASAEGAPVLAVMQALPDVLAYRSRLKALLIPRNLIDAGLVPGGGWYSATRSTRTARSAGTPTPSASWSSSGATSSAARSGPAPPPGGAARRPSSCTARHGLRSAATS